MKRAGSEFYPFLFPKSGVHLHSMLVNCGYQTVDSASYRWDGMKRGSGDMVIWQYTLAGAGAFDFGGRTIPEELGCQNLKTLKPGEPAPKGAKLLIDKNGTLATH